MATNPFHQLRSRLVFQCAIKELFTTSDPPKVSSGQSIESESADDDKEEHDHIHDLDKAKDVHLS